MRGTTRISVRSAGAALLVVAGILATVPARADQPVPTYGTGALTGFATEFYDPGGEPPGVVNGPCKPSQAHPYPVVLVHGTSANANFSWQTLAPMLANAGYCVFGLNYGATSGTTYSGGRAYALDYVKKSADQLYNFIHDVVLPDTGAMQVDIVGHSQGGMMPRYLIDSTGDLTYPGLGHAALVHSLIGLAPSNQGTTLEGLTTIFGFFGGYQYSVPGQFGCGACADQQTGSPFLTALNKNGDAQGPNYYVIESKLDEVVTPYTNAFLPDGPNVLNVTLQDQCPTDLTEHLGIIYDPVALQDVVNALDQTTFGALPPPTCPAVVAPVVSG